MPIILSLFLLFLPVRYINFGKQNTFSYGIEILNIGKWGNYNDIYLWAKSYNIYVHKDSPPIIDNQYRYLHQNGSCILFKGISIFSSPTIFIDLVSFSNTENLYEIKTATIKLASYRKIIKYGKGISLNSPIIIHLSPYMFEKAGRVLLCIKAEQKSASFFAFWDIILFYKMR
jgi:hypothetical protein